MQFELEARADRRAENSTLYCFRRRYAMRPPFRIPLRNLRRRRKKKPFGFFRWRREWDMFRLLVNAETRFGSSRTLMQFELEARADRRAENSTLYCFRRRYAMRPPFRIPLRNLRRRRKKKPFGFFRWRREWDSNPRDRKVKRFSRPPRYDRFDIPPYLIVKYH